MDTVGIDLPPKKSGPKALFSRRPLDVAPAQDRNRADSEPLVALEQE
jgi:hypothetical protein